MQARTSRPADHAWTDLERSAVKAGLPLPLPSRGAWSRLHGQDARLLSVHGTDGQLRALLGFQLSASRALPGHVLLRAQHAGAALSGNAGAELIAAARDLAHNEPRVLRMNIETVLRTEAERRLVAERMRGAGFRELEFIRHYRDTLIVDLSGSEAEILASFSQTTRRDLRGWESRGVEMRTITDERYGARLNELARETFARTGGAFEPRPWPARIALGRELPEASRLVGLFRAGRDDPEALLAYAWGCNHGDHAHYDDAGSTRVEDIKVSMMYPLMWDLIRWAKAQGCTWFDLGGAVPAEARHDPRAGISDFKRRFSKNLVRVGGEWEYEPNPARAALARLARAAAKRLRG